MKSIRTFVHTLLRKSEKYTRTDMVYLASGSFWMMLGSVAASLSGLLLAIAFANLLPQNDYGTYKYVLSIVGILSVITLPHMNVALTRAAARGDEKTIKKGVSTRIQWGVFAGIALLLIGSYYYLQGDLVLASSFIISGVFIPFTDTFSAFGALLEGRKDFKRSNIYGLVIQAVSAIALIGSLLLFKSIILLFLIYFSATTLIRYYFYRITVKNSELAGKSDDKSIEYGKRLSWVSIVGTIASHLDKILLWQFLGAATLAVYSFSLAPVDQIRNLLKSFNPLAFPKLANQKPEDIRSFLLGKVGKYVILTLPIVVLYIITAPFIFDFFFPNYMSSVLHSQIYAIIIALAPVSLLGTALTSQAREKQVYFLRTAGPIVRIILILLLIPVYGILGGVLALIATSVMNTIFLLWFTIKIPRKTLF